MTPGAERLKIWREHYDIAARELFGITPDVWQDEAFKAFPHSPRLAMKACAGPGKTMVLAIVGLVFILTHPHARCGATSISGPNLKANLWKELAFWYGKSPLLQREFEFTTKEIYHRQHRQTWGIEARTWAQDANASEIGNVLRGLHGEYVLWLLDESGSYPAAIMPVLENIFAGAPKEAHIVQAGNCTSTSGPLYRAAVTARHLWTVIDITGDPDDPKRSPRIGMEYAREQIAQYGRDNPWVMINILGQFPPSSLNSLLGPSDIEASWARRYTQRDIEQAAKLLGVDVARFGDDASIIFPRRGLVAFKPAVLRNADGNQGAGQVNRMWAESEPDAVFIDNSGGYGASWIDGLARMNRSPIPVDFSGKAADPRYFNKRTEMYFLAAEWVRRGGALPEDCPELMADLTETTYTFKGDKMLLEPKDMVKAKIGRSPDWGDGFVLTFAEPVTRRVAASAPQQGRASVFEPFRELQQLNR